MGKLLKYTSIGTDDKTYIVGELINGIVRSVIRVDVVELAHVYFHKDKKPECYDCKSTNCVHVKLAKRAENNDKKLEGE
jgi:hypothetical protein